jgi:hypothetical protein
LSTVAIHTARNSRSGFGSGCAFGRRTRRLTNRIRSTTNFWFVNISNAGERPIREEIFDHRSPHLRIFFFQQANDVRRILFRAAGSPVSLEFFSSGFSFADADRELMTASAMIDDPSRDHKNRGLVRYVFGERINLKNVIRALTSV